MKKMVACIALLVLSDSLWAGPFEVQVGYADNLRPSGFFPSPWFGDPGVHWAGEVPSFVGQYDSGAVRLINNSGGTIHITDLVVDSFENGASFHIWGGKLPITLLAGESAIFVQTSGQNFDSSDQPIHGLPSSTAQPKVHFTVDGTTFDLTDTAQVLNTEGNDLLAATNESHAWRDIGTFGGQAGVPEPASLTLLGIGIAGMSVYGWRRKKQQEK
jgi:hypothetical protein